MGYRFRNIFLKQFNTAASLDLKGPSPPKKVVGRCVCNLKLVRSNALQLSYDTLLSSPITLFLIQI
jgi:hypothetical protein